MIARIWHGKTTSLKADVYMKEYFLQTGLADYEATEGNLGVIVMRKDEGSQADLLMLTFWDSEEAIKKFAGDDINKARYYPGDIRYFSELEPNVVHYMVLINRMNSSVR